jgi:hypothetical protein
VNNSKHRINSKTKLLAAVSLLLVASMSLGALMTVSAHTPIWEIPTFAYITVFPDPVGVNQQVTIYVWVDKVWPSASNLGASANQIRPMNYKLTILKPDGTTELTKTWPIVQDPTSSQYYLWVPKSTGTYTLKFDFPQQTYTWSGAYNGDVYLASHAETTLVVQQEELPPPVYSYPLPTEYWTRPVNGESTESYRIASNWFGTVPGIAGFGSQSAVTARDPVGVNYGALSSHIMWSTPIQDGGVVGGNIYPVNGATLFEGSAYNNRYTNPIIMMGKLYYTDPLSFSQTTGGPTKCVDLRTGEVIWSRTDVPALSFGYMYDVQDVNNHGVYPPLLFTSNFARAFDAYTGNPMFNVTGVPTGTGEYGTNGEQLRYVFQNLGNNSVPNYVLARWNSSRMWTYTGLAPAVDTSTISTGVVAVNASIMDTGPEGGLWTAQNSHNRFDWNFSIPWRNTMTSSPTVIAAFRNDVMICRNGSLSSLGVTTQAYTYFAVNLNPTKGGIGQVLWWKTYTHPPGNYSIYNGGADPQSRIFLEMYKEGMQWIGYSMEDGRQVWGPTESQAAMDYYGQPAYPILGGQVANGKLYSCAYAGIVYCYNMADGQLLWTYGNGGAGNSTSGGFAIPYGRYPTFLAAMGETSIPGESIVYLVTTEHTVSTPIYKGAMARAIDGNTGKELWTLPAYTGSFTALGYAIADGYSTYFNGYDNQIYVVGKGPSALTVDAPLAAITKGSSLIIRGTVTDTAAGTQGDEQIARFPHGVPAVSDENMTEWMAYVYMQRPFPSDVVGVKVKLTLIGPDYSVQEVTTNSDALGQYSVQFKPEAEGMYTVVANFEGSNSYFPSTAETFFAVDAAAAAPTAAPTTAAPTEAPTTAAPTTAAPTTTAPEPGNPNMTYAYVAIAAVVIIVVVLAAAVMLRRRK